MFLIRRARPADAAPLAELAARTFHEAFAAGNTPEDLAAYLAQTYGKAQQLREILDDDVITLVTEEDGELIAFAQVRRGPAPECVAGPDPVELARFYVDRPFHGRGIAQQLMDAARAAARNLGGRTFWLGVWEHNPRAIAFYVKCGFRDVGSHLFLVGSDLQTDRVMVVGC
ncbi:MAG TPA: GNAT family N-acetyltransferase [Thermoanaerobaculia bacterium]|nr:GNAT family N-acetyltransferase [Thermoanaerobaculia bacterium]